MESQRQHRKEKDIKHNESIKMPLKHEEYNQLQKCGTVLYSVKMLPRRSPIMQHDIEGGKGMQK